MDNSNCYWQAWGLCGFDPDDIQPCELDKPCMRYVSDELVDEYLRGLIDYNNFLEKTLQEYEDGLR